MFVEWIASVVAEKEATPGGFYQNSFVWAEC